MVTMYVNGVSLNLTGEDYILEVKIIAVLCYAIVICISYSLRITSVSVDL